MIALYVVAGAFLLLAILSLFGKGDGFIRFMMFGQPMDKYDVKYLRASTFMMFLILAALTGCLAEPGLKFMSPVIVLMVAMIALYYLLAYTLGRKKSAGA